MTHFFDTSALLTADLDNLDEYPFLISVVTLKELEDIKSSGHKDEDIKLQARHVTRWLVEHGDAFEVIMPCKGSNWNTNLTNDELIMESALSAQREGYTLLVHTNDMCFSLIAHYYYGLECVNDLAQNTHEDIYRGYKIVTPTETELAEFYQDRTVNRYDCLINEYVIFSDEQNQPIEAYKWDGNKYASIDSKTFRSQMFGQVKAKDIIQRCAFDSLQSNDITFLFGKAGSGKTMLSLAYIMSMIESHKFRTVHIVYSYDTLKGNKTLGYEKGDHVQKLICSGALGNILASKFGDTQAVERMLASGMLDIIPTANIRGVEFPEDDCVFVTEAQNLDTYTLKTLIQRCKCKLVLDGDCLEQSDINRPSGVFRMLDVFKGDKSFGCIKLKNNYRDHRCELADKM